MNAAPIMDTKALSVVLIAEDEQAIAAIVCSVVEDAGFLPVVARNGREALALARSARPALIITDLMMPYLTGVELIAALRAEEEETGSPHIPVILMTAANPPMARSAGADKVLYKPFDIDALETLVRHFMDERA